MQLTNKQSCRENVADNEQQQGNTEQYYYKWGEVGHTFTHKHIRRWNTPANRASQQAGSTTSSRVQSLCFFWKVARPRRDFVEGGEQNIVYLVRDVTFAYFRKRNEQNKKFKSDTGTNTGIVPQVWSAAWDNKEQKSQHMRVSFLWFLHWSKQKEIDNFIFAGQGKLKSFRAVGAGSVNKCTMQRP